MAWPDLTEYHEAVQFPTKVFRDGILQQSNLELDRFGMPKPATGANAVVYRALQKTGETWAVRCFLRPITDHAERYAAISKHLQQMKLVYSCHFDFLPEGVRVRKDWFPVVKMAWVEGELLHRYIERNLQNRKALEILRERWRKMARDLELAKMAHGDLQQGNILVRNNNFLLIDYDGMWVPQLAGKAGTEIGHRAFQHPLRSQADYGPTLDRFSSLVIYLSFMALERRPELWEFHNGDNLLFTPEDYVEVENTPLWKALREVNSAQLDYFTTELVKALQNPPSQMASLESIISKAPQKLPVWLQVELGK